MDHRHVAARREARDGVQREERVWTLGHRLLRPHRLPLCLPRRLRHHLCLRHLRHPLCLRRIRRIRRLPRLYHSLPLHCRRLHLLVIANTWVLSSTLLCLRHTNAQVWLRARPSMHWPHMQRGRHHAAEIAPDGQPRSVGDVPVRMRRAPRGGRRGPRGIKGARHRSGRAQVGDRGVR